MENNIKLIFTKKDEGSIDELSKEEVIEKLLNILKTEKFKEIKVEIK